MESTSMTALVSLFARAYHKEHNSFCIFEDSVAGRLMSEEEKTTISKSMEDGITFFNPAFRGAPKEALRWIVDNQLSPSPLGRAAFAESSLETAVHIGATQYLILGAGYDTFAYRQPEWAEAINIFEADLEAMANDKKQRLVKAGITVPDNTTYISLDLNSPDWKNSIVSCPQYSTKNITLCSILGVLYYLPKESTRFIMKSLSEILSTGSSIVFDYPDENTFTRRAGIRTRKQLMLAGQAKEKMYSGYSYSSLEKLLSDNGFYIYEHLTPKEITGQYFAEYNEHNKGYEMTAFDNVNYCLAVKKS